MRRLAALLSMGLLLGASACGQPTDPPTSTPPNTPPNTPPEDPPEALDTPSEPSCDEQLAETLEAFSNLTPEVTACAFDHECMSMPVETDCGALCPVAVHTAQRDGFMPADLPDCDGCERAQAQCARSTPRCHEGHCLMDEGDPPLREVTVPEANRPGQDPPPGRPAPGAPEEERGRRLLAAIHADDPSLAQDFFFPREAFSQVKAIGDPDGYWQRLYARFATDVHALHESLALESEPEFVSLNIIRRGGWVPRGEEGNALPYWVSRHSQLRYRVDGETRQLEVRVLITWGERWYITHLSEFH